MKERPILFSAPMVRAILEGRKTQTRRVAKPQPRVFACGSGISVLHEPCPYGQPGDRLWVKETTVKVEDHGYQGPVYVASENGRACLDGGLAPAPDDCTEVEPWELKLRPSIFMPKSMARIWLEVTAVRVERLQDISDDDAIAEGVDPAPGIRGDDYLAIYQILQTFPTLRLAPVARFVLLWDSINGKPPGVANWNANPWVWVVEFKRVAP